MKSLKAAIITLALAAIAPAFARTDAMQGMDKEAAKAAKASQHQAVGVVKNVDAGTGKVTLAHGPVKTLNWPAMTMSFGVKDKRLLDKLGVGKQVQVAFEKQGEGFVITSVNTSVK